MLLIVGLGNPTKKYQKTRHNFGFQVIEEFRKKNNFSNFKFQKNLNSLISEGKINDKKIILAKPQTFINLSGKAIKKIIENWNLKIENLIIIHDDIDLSLEKIKISIARGSAGHKGVESIIQELKTKNFLRFRLGIQPKSGKPKNIEKFVLQKFNKKEKEIVKKVIRETIERIRFFALRPICKRYELSVKTSIHNNKALSLRRIA